ncbi:MAG: ABC transporter ATP-binding protein [Proteobacteria bacterium]|nr:ABC transporter ATP-binding protein [Pseudomonadota bacterium]MBS0463732.1 ABC transporter ATP-binding protein [Pseudomonadota bacterium]
MNRQPTLAAEGIAKAYTTGKLATAVLDGLSVTLGAGELALVLGPSGSGKSTLLAILSGLLRPDRGRVVALGEDLWRLSRAELERFRLHHTGFVFQGFNLFPALTAVEQVMLPLGYLGLNRRNALVRAMAALEEVGLESRAQLRPLEMSGGEKQRVAIARALAKQPQLVFADEPTSALDSTNGKIVIDSLHRIARRFGATVVCVSHDQRLAAGADRVITIQDGLLLSDRVQSDPPHAGVNRASALPPDRSP